MAGKGESNSLPGPPPPMSLKHKGRQEADEKVKGAYHYEHGCRNGQPARDIIHRRTSERTL